MNRKFIDYNIIPIGDHCALPMALNDIGLRKKSYPFDWTSNIDQLYKTNIYENVKLIEELDNDKVENIVKKYIGNALISSGKVNSNNNIWFPHEKGDMNEIYSKYERRFNRLKEDLNKKNLFILLTRHYYIDEDSFNQIIKTLLKHNKESIILYISGINHKYFEKNNYENVMFRHINYDISKFYNYDYSDFRPNINNYLSLLLL